MISEVAIDYGLVLDWNEIVPKKTRYCIVKPSLSEKDDSIFLVKIRYQVVTNRPSPNTHSANLVI